MTDPGHRSVARAAKLLTLAGLLLGGCSTFAPPDASSIAGLSPDGTVTLDETFVTGAAEGSGRLQYQGRTYPFILVGTVMGPGGGLSKINAAGEVYKLATVTDFAGRYTQGTGPVGLATPGSGELWLRNGSGVIMHLTDTRSGALLSVGRDQILIRMSQEAPADGR